MKKLLILIFIAFVAFVVYGWINDCENTAGIFISCEGEL